MTEGRAGTDTKTLKLILDQVSLLEQLEYHVRNVNLGDANIHIIWQRGEKRKRDGGSEAGR